VSGNGQFRKGVSGNPGGRRKDKPWADAIRAEVDKVIRGKGVTNLEGLAKKVWALAQRGEPWAVQEIGNRLDGRPPQQVAHTGADDGPIEFAELTNEEAARRMVAIIERGLYRPDEKVTKH
tara:strand:+ start:117 stop:479 length:363 start_codon:yes stop_codon:yes gene_type:complete